MLNIGSIFSYEQMEERAEEVAGMILGRWRQGDPQKKEREGERRRGKLGGKEKDVIFVLPIALSLIAAFSCSGAKKSRVISLSKVFLLHKAIMQVNNFNIFPLS